jgi:hypothetical protein
MVLLCDFVSWWLIYLNIKSVDALSRRFDLLAAHSGGGEFYRFIDFDIAGASAQIPRKRFLDLFPIRSWVDFQQLFCDQQKRRRAIATLRGAQVSKRFLQWMKLPVVAHPIYRRNIPAYRIETEKETREYRLAVDQNGADSALTKFASVLCSGEREVFAQDLEQCFVRRERDFGFLVVEREFD